MFRNLFRPDSPLMITMTQITDCIFLSMFWLVGCIPVVTAGASFAALYDATFRAFRQGEKNSWQRFWYSFRQNWKSGIVPTLVAGAGAYTVARILILIWNGAAVGEISMAVFTAAAVIGALFLGMGGVLFAVLSRFENSAAMLLKNAVLLSLANLPRTLGLGVMNSVCVFLCLRYVYPLFFLPSLAALLGSLLLEPMFKPYMPVEDAAE